MDYEIVAAGLNFPEGPLVLDDGQLIVCEVAGGRLMRVARELIEFSQDHPHETPGQLSDLARQAEMLMSAIYHQPMLKTDAAAAAAE